MGNLIKESMKMNGNFFLLLEKSFMEKDHQLL